MKKEHGKLKSGASLFINSQGKIRGYISCIEVIHQPRLYIICVVQISITKNVTAYIQRMRNVKNITENMLF